MPGSTRRPLASPKPICGSSQRLRTPTRRYPVSPASTTYPPRLAVKPSTTASCDAVLAGWSGAADRRKARTPAARVIPAIRGPQTALRASEFPAANGLLRVATTAMADRQSLRCTIRGVLRRLDRFQQRHKAIAIGFAVLKKFSDDGAAAKAALIAYFGFFSLFPLLLLLVSILGFLLGANSSLEHAVLHSALRQFPIVGGQLGSPHALAGNGIGLAVGLVGAVLPGLGVTMAAQNAFNTVYAVPYKRQANALLARWRGLKLLVVFGTLQLISTAVSGAVAGGLGGALLTVAGILVSLLINVAMFLAIFRLLTDAAVTTHELWPGILLASVSWEVLQSLGGVYIGHVVRGAGSTYGTFAVVIGLLVLALPRRARAGLCRRDQRRAGPRPVAAQPGRGARSGGPPRPYGAGKDGGARRLPGGGCDVRSSGVSR